ncbi:helix-turn-helix domain-containing protein [Halomicroarcula sp. GCM10025709]|uniref:helix-turn-helix domain-containing protein n=1 Tax=Haloarcula TaxID=2237 RepID=UPI0024C31970|nr:helix-turn-helix domain-containing protein [Halomicroarcula sp. YJ-61-S]
MSEDCPTVEVLALLDDPYARDILTATSEQPMSAKTLSERCDASLPTVYRRAERLVESGLLEERTEIAEDGHHYSVYEARLRRLAVELEDGTLSVELEEKQEIDVADRFTEMWDGI